MAYDSGRTGESHAPPTILVTKNWCLILFNSNMEHTEVASERKVMLVGN